MAKNQIDQLVYQAVFDKDKTKKKEARYKIWQQAVSSGIILSSINDFYLARGKEEIKKIFTVPAINIRGMAYNTARAAFKAAKDLNVGAMIFEIARSEMVYTDQSPNEYVTVISAAAIKEEWSGPLFIQGDHYQAKNKAPGQPKQGEIKVIKALIKQSVDAGFYNIDIDMSTLVDLNKSDVVVQQEPNAKYSAILTEWTRSLEPKGMSISIGGEIGHIGGKNSTIEDFTAYIDQYNKLLPSGMVGMSKISVQTGTHHGGVVLPDGSLADVNVDFSILSDISKVGRKKYQIGGAVQHGASTLPDKFFAQFVKSEAIEVHLATGFQNIIMDHAQFPKDLLQTIYDWLKKEKIDEKKSDQTEEQFFYSLRKKAWGQFKKESWNISEERQEQIRQSLIKRFKFMFTQLNVGNTQELISKYVKTVVVEKKLNDFEIQGKTNADVKGLSD